MDCSLPESSVLGIFQTWMLEWVAISSSRGSSWPRDWTCISSVSCITGIIGWTLCNHKRPLKCQRKKCEDILVETCPCKLLVFLSHLIPVEYSRAGVKSQVLLLSLGGWIPDAASLPLSPADYVTPCLQVEHLSSGLGWGTSELIICLLPRERNLQAVLCVLNFTVLWVNTSYTLWREE